MYRGKIRPPRKAAGVTRSTGSADEFEENWVLLHDALDNIHHQNAGKLSFEQLYRAAYRIVLKKRGEELYMRVCGYEERFLVEKILPQLWQLLPRPLAAAMLGGRRRAAAAAAGASSSSSAAVAAAAAAAATASSASNVHARREMGERLLRGVRDAWTRHSISMGMLADVLMYLDRGYAQDSNRPFVYPATIGLFRDKILDAQLPHLVYDAAAGDGYGYGYGYGYDDGGGAPPPHPTMYTVLSAVLLDQIDMDRDGEIVDRALLHSCVAMLEALYETGEELEDDKLYLTRFEPQFLAAMRVYYRVEAARLLRDGDARAWLRQTERRLREEQDRCSHTVAQETMPRSAEVLEQTLISAHLEAFLALDGSGLKAMVDDDRTADLAILYELVQRTQDKQAVLRQALQAHVVELGGEIDKALRETAAAAAASTATTAAAAATAAADAQDGDGDGPGAAGAKAAPLLSAAAQQTAAAIRWVGDILSLKDKFDELWRVCFRRDMAIQSAITSSFTELFRLCTRSAEYVSLYIDDTFKRGLRGKSDAEIDAALDRCIIMVQHVTEKDMLERYYQKHLARRLLHNKSENPEAEKLMIARMQAELGKAFTAKFEGMFKDMATSEELTRDYARYVHELGGSGDSGGRDGDDGDDGNSGHIDLAVSVLTSNNWPPEVMGRSSQLEESAAGRRSGGDGGDGNKGGGDGSCTYPPEIRRLQRSFLKFYLRNRSGRVLSWVGSAGSADVRCVFPPIDGHDKGPLSRERRYELSVSTHGMVVLLLFNSVADGATLSFAEIQGQTGIPAGELTRTLAALSLPAKCRVLAKTPTTKTVRATDHFAVNTHFVSRTLRVKVPVIHALSKVEPDDERRATETKNNQTRAHTIDAAVVRIMKQRKELTHAGLVAEVVAQLVGRFRPEVAMVKKRIEDLISREYLDRIEDSNPPAYRYVA